MSSKQKQDTRPQDLIRGYQADIAELRAKIRAARSEQAHQPVDDYVFATTNGAVSLTQLFGDRDTLFLIHNMGSQCAYCTMWADGLNGVLDHLTNKAAVVVSSGDTPEHQAEFAASRGWRFTLVSHANNTFAADMGYQQDGRLLPGISIFRRSPAGIVRLADNSFGPDDDYCVVWHFFSLLPEGSHGWQPKFSYN